MKQGWFDQLLNPWCDDGLINRLWATPQPKPKWTPQRRAEEKEEKQ
jgi:hypothetical protein